MARLIVMGTHEIDVPDVARNKALTELSEKRITKAVREALRKRFGHGSVEVSCTATLSQGRIWTGQCKINGLESSYRLMAGLYDRPATHVK